MLTVQPVGAEPWSARQAQIWSISVSLAFTTRLLVALPDTAPPMRKYTSCTLTGSPAWLAEEPAVPTVSSALLFTVPASNSRPEIFTPLTSATVIAFTPLSGVSVGKPMPSTPPCRRA